MTNSPEAHKNVEKVNNDPQPPDIDCFCVFRSSGMEAIQIPCCKKKLHVVRMFQRNENYGHCPYCQGATKTEDLILAEIVDKSNGT